MQAHFLRMAAVLCGLSFTAAHAQNVATLIVGPAGGKPAADFATIQAAVDAAPATGAILRIRPGTYREVVHVDKPNITLHGETTDPSKVVLVFANGASNTCGTFCSPTLFVTGDGFSMDEMTVANDWSKTGQPRTQAVALSINADRAVIRNVRLLGAQDTLLADTKKCDSAAGACHASRQYFDRCYIEGEVDFIFGAARAVFEDCEIHSIPHDGGGYLTAQSRTSLDQDSGYDFYHCRLTADAGVQHIYLGRPWRDYATVTFMDTEMGAHIDPAGWSEWGRAGSGHDGPKGGETHRLATAVYAEYNSTGPGASPTTREPMAKQLTAAEAKVYEPKVFLGGDWMKGR